MRRVKQTVSALAVGIALAVAIPGAALAVPAFPEEPGDAVYRGCVAVLGTSQTGWANMSVTAFSNTVALFTDACFGG